MAPNPLAPQKGRAESAPNSARVAWGAIASCPKAIIRSFRSGLKPSVPVAAPSALTYDGKWDAACKKVVRAYGHGVDASPKPALWRIMHTPPQRGV
jgi:hypothetical protein